MRTTTSTATKPAAPPVGSAAYYDLAALHEMSAGSHEFVVSLVKIFLDTIPANSRDMVQATINGQWDMVSKLAHKLKSTVDMMRIETIRQDIRTIEMDAKNQVNKELLCALAKKVELIIHATATQLRKEFGLN